MSKTTIPVISYSLEFMGGLFEGFFPSKIHKYHIDLNSYFKIHYVFKICMLGYLFKKYSVFKVNFAENER